MNKQLKNPVFRTEGEMVEFLTAFLLDNGYAVRLEVSNMGQSADVVATKNRWVTAIEAKLNKWSVALNQAIAHEIVADFVCIAVSCNATSRLIDSVLSRGYGLIFCDPYSGDCDWLIEPKINKKVWKPQRGQFLRSLRDIDYAY